MPFGSKAPNLTHNLTRQAQNAKAEMEKSGYYVPLRPMGELPTVPEYLTELDDDALMNLFSKLVAWTDHIAGQLVLQEVDERYAGSTHDLLRDQVLADTMAGKTRNEASVTASKAEANLHPNVRAARETADHIYARRKILGLMLTNLERDGALVSRELSRRIGRSPLESRAARFNP